MEPQNIVVKRNRTFDVLRVIFALMVLYAHAYEMRRVNTHQEIFDAIGAHYLTWGAVGVDGFFLLSGALIVQSWLRSPHLGDFLQKRILRIVPGYVVAVLLSVLVIGWLFPAEPGFFRHLGFRFPLSIVTLSAPSTPDAFPKLGYGSVNGSLWTITYEFRCYLLVALFGITSLLRRRSIWLAMTAAFIVVSLWPHLEAMLSWHHWLLFTGDPKFYYRLVPIFMIGGCFALFKDKIPFRGWIAAVSAVVMVVSPHFSESIFALAFGYVLFWLGSLRLSFLESHRQMPDISYGLYLYGWPIEGAVLTFLSPWPVPAFLLTSVFAGICGWLSWHFVERPMLQLKKGRHVEPPPA